MSAPLGRPREYDEEHILKNIMSVFWENGYEATGLSLITAATGLQKGSLYKAFANKKDMYVKALMYYEKHIVDQAAASLLSESAAPLERIEAFLNAPMMAIDKKDFRGCFLCNAAADSAGHDDKTRTLVAQGYGKLEQALRAPIADLHPEWSQSQQEMRAQLCVSVYAGLRIMSRAAVERRRLEGARDACLESLSRKP